MKHWVSGMASMGRDPRLLEQHGQTYRGRSWLLHVKATDCCKPSVD